MQIKRSLGEFLFDHANVLFLFGLMLVTLYPLVHVLFAWSARRPG